MINEERYLILENFAEECFQALTRHVLLKPLGEGEEQLEFTFDEFGIVRIIIETKLLKLQDRFKKTEA